MTGLAKKILEEAQGLSAEERRDVALELLDLSEVPTELEIEERVAAAHSGTSKTVAIEAHLAFVDRLLSE